MKWALLLNRLTSSDSYYHPSSDNNNAAYPVGDSMNIIGDTIEACSIILRNIVTVVAAVGENNNSSNNNNSSSSKEDTQAVLEAIYRSHLIEHLIDACRTYGSNSNNNNSTTRTSTLLLSGKCVATVANVLSELVLSSSKFLNQVSSRLFE